MDWGREGGGRKEGGGPGRGAGRRGDMSLTYVYTACVRRVFTACIVGGSLDWGWEIHVQCAHCLCEGYSVHVEVESSQH